MKKTLYTWGTVTPFEVAAGLVPRAYLSLYTALCPHELTKQVPKQIYVNQEQSAKTLARISPTQADLNAAYLRPQLASKSRGEYDGYTLIMLYGQYTGQLGVVNHRYPTANRVPITNLERTRRDCTA